MSVSPRKSIALLAMLVTIAAAPTFAQSNTYRAPAPADPVQSYQPTAPQHAATAPRRQPLFRHANIDAAWKAAQKSGRPVLVYVSSKQCHYCEKMIRETWSNPQIASAVAQRFEPVAVLKENDPELVKRLGVRAYPTTVVVTAKGELANQLRGFANPQKFASLVLAPPKLGQMPVKPASYRKGRR